MKKLLKFISIVAGSIVLLVIVAALALVLFVSPNRLKPLLTAQVMALTGRQLIIDGDLAWTFFPALGIKTGHIALSNPAGFQQPLLAEVQAANISVRVLPLLHKKIQSNGIILHGVKLYLIKNAKGEVNWNFPRPLPQTKPLSSAHSAPASLPHAMTDLSIASLQISDGEVMWINEQTNQSARFDQLTLQAKKISLLQPFPLEVGFRFTNQSPVLTGQVTLTTDLSMSLARQIISLRALTVHADIQQAPQTFHVTITGNVVADLLQQTLQCSDFRAAVDNLIVTGKATVTDLSRAPNAAADLHLEPVDLKAWLKNSGQDVPNLQAFKQVSGDLNMTFANHALNLQGKLNADEIQANHMKLTQVILPFHFQRNILSLTAVTANFYQGTLKTNATVHLQSTPLQIAADANLSQVQIEPLLDDLGSAKNALKLSGRADVNFQITTAGATSDAMIKNLNGSGRFALPNGTLEGIDLRYYTEIAKALLAQRTPSATNTNKTEFANLTGSVTIKNGVLENNDLLLVSPLFTSKGKGAIDLVNQQINYQINTQVNSTGAMENTGWADITKVAIPIFVTGGLSQPTIRLDSKALTKAVAEGVLQKTKQNLQDNIKKQLGGQGGALLQNLLGH